MDDLESRGGTAWWSVAVQDLVAGLGSGPGGLSPDEAKARLATAGPNQVTEERDLGWERLLLAQFASPLVLILVFAALVSLVLRDWVEAAIILAIVAGSALLGFAQEFRASRAVAELQRRIALTGRVRRGGDVLAVPTRDLVPGDVVLLAAGNLVPADGRVLEARDFLVSEAAPDRGILPGREGARHRRRRRVARRSQQQRLPRHLGAQRHGHGARRAHGARPRPWARSRHASARRPRKRSSRAASAISATCSSG